MTEKLIGALKAWGCDTDGSLRRVVGDAELYAELVEGYNRELDLERLARSVEAGDVSAAFRAAHAAKGVLGNLGITPLERPVAELTGIFRAGSCAGCGETLALALAAKARFDRIVAENT